MPYADFQILEKNLQTVFQLSSFRPDQEIICQAILTGHDLLAILPTGGGKSLCYQLPATCLPGLTIVISPLLSLINDQVAKLNQLSVAAAAITSQQTPTEKIEITTKLTTRSLKLLYLSPEQLQNPHWQKIWQMCQISCVVVDEAHCVAEWGNDFRPAYLQIKHFLTTLTPRPTVAAFTATATPATVAVITTALGLQKPRIIKQTALRKNLQINIHRPHSTTEKLVLLTSYLTRKNHTPAIIYCSTRNATEELANWLQTKAKYFPELFPTTVSSYHAGLDSALRQKLEHQFISNQIEILVATTAFGMGVDKPNTRLVIHWQIPNSIENFCQEIGRAGRDLQPASSVLLADFTDLHIHQTLFADLQKTQPIFYRQKIAKLMALQQLTTHQACINRLIADYFGEPTTAVRCGRCSYCQLPTILDPTPHQLFKQLCQWRQKLATNHVPLTKSILLWVALLRPRTMNQFLHIPGFGLGLRQHYQSPIQDILTTLLTHSPQPQTILAS